MNSVVMLTEKRTMLVLLCIQLNYMYNISWFPSQELLEKLSKCELPKNEYSCMNDPSSTDQETTRRGSVRKSHASPAPAIPERKAPAQSMRSRRTTTWARTSNSDDGYSRYNGSPYNWNVTCLDHTSHWLLFPWYFNCFHTEYHPQHICYLLWLW